MKLAIQKIAFCMLVLLAYSHLNQLLAQDNAPNLANMPDQTIGLGGSFENLDLTTYLTELDGDNILWTHSFIAPTQVDDQPTWSVNASEFQFSLNMTAVVSSRGQKSIGDTHLLAAFVGDEVRGVTSAISVGDDWMYFLTVYSNLEGEQITFKFYDATNQLLLPVSESLDFTANGIIGDAVNPQSLSAAYVRISINEDQKAEISVVDAHVTFSETITIVATDDTQNSLSGYDQFTLSLIDDHSPVLAGIPDQDILFEEEFTAFDLDDYLTLSDADEVEVFVSGNTELIVDIDVDHIVNITKPDNEWSGMEQLTFIARDVTENALQSSDEVIFTVQTRDNAPVILTIPDQKTGVGGNFKELNLNDFHSELDGHQTVWSFKFAPNENPESIPAWDSDAGNFQFSMTITATVSSLGRLVAGTNHILAAFNAEEVRGVTQAIEVGNDWVYFLTIHGNIQGEAIELRFYDADDQRILPIAQSIEFQPNHIIGDPIDPVSLEAGEILLNLRADNTITAEIVREDFIGSERVVFFLQDTNTVNRLRDSDTISYTVVSEPFPELSDIPGQVINEGESFQILNLNDFLVNFDGSNVSWAVAGAEALNVVISDGQATITAPDSDWHGSESLTFISSVQNDPDLTDSDLATFEVINVNDPPIINSTPIDQIIVGTNYTYLITTEDVDHDDLVITSTGVPDWLTFKDIGDGTAILFGLPTELDIGTHVVEIIVDDQNGGVRTQTFNLEVALETVTSISSDLNSNVAIYPNPVGGILNVTMNSFTSMNIGRFRIIDLSGKTVYQSAISNDKIDVSDLRSGVYLFEVTMGEGSTYFKFVKN